MDIYSNLNLKPVRLEPDIWVKRLIIFEQVTPEPKVIRDIPLSKGLNIIWAEESENDNSPTEITGHSAGKTTFCRMLRYVLGEKTYGTRTNMDLIQKALPDGYIAAELTVQGKKWAVMRPTRKSRSSYIKDNATIEELLKDRSHPAYSDTYTQEIGIEGLANNFRTGIIRTGESIQWRHILSWCARDQENRFQNIYEWRSPRSESEPPGFRFPKADPLFVMRATLGLFLSDEIKGEEKLADLLKQKDKLTQQLEEKKREPQFRINLYEQQLRNHLKTILPDEKDIDMIPFHSGELLRGDIYRLTDTAIEQIEKDIKELERDRTTIQGELDDIGARIRELERELAELDALFNFNTAATEEISVSLLQRQERQKKFEELKNKTCKLGDVIIKECQHVKERQEIVQLSEFRDIHNTKSIKARQDDEFGKINKEKERLREIIDKLKHEQQDSLAKREIFIDQLTEKREKLRDLKSNREEIETWTAKMEKPGGYEELDNIRNKIEVTERERVKLENELTGLLREHDQNRKLLESIFSGAVRSVLPSGIYDGKVSIENRELAFCITNGPAMSGEAVETLSVLLSDIASLIYNTVSANSHLPGFLLHDSPREADLGGGIYRSFIRFAASLQVHFDELDNCPFQYILTTTTAPPSELQNDQYVKLKLNAAQPTGLLLKRNIAFPSADSSDANLFL
jgi:hypothetical protein